MAHNQTVTFLLKRFEEVGIRPDARKGQNFLIDLNLQGLLVDAAELEPRDVVLEIGTGTGALTELIAEQAAEVVTVEVDRHLYEMACELLIDVQNVTALQQDALKNKNRFAAGILEVVQQKLDSVEDGRFKLIANLPYNVATPVLSNLLLTDPHPATMTATIQKELADRMMARPRTKDYGSLSIWMQGQCHIELVRTLSPSVFWPRPKVTSAIIHVTVDEEKRARIPDLRYFQQFLRALFLHRRKFLRSVFISAMKRHLDKPQADAILAEMNFDADTRAEQLEVETMLQFCELTRAAAPDWRLH